MISLWDTNHHCPHLCLSRASLFSNSFLTFPLFHSVLYRKSSFPNHGCQAFLSTVSGKDWLMDGTARRLQVRERERPRHLSLSLLQKTSEQLVHLLHALAPSQNAFVVPPKPGRPAIVPASTGWLQFLAPASHSVLPGQEAVAAPSIF